MLNRLTDEIVKEAAREEIKTGVRWVKSRISISGPVAESTES